MTGLYAESTNGHIFKNYCSSAGTGFNIVPAASAGGAPLIERNYVRAAVNSIQTDAVNGYATIRHNIIGDGDLAPSANSTLDENICDDPTDCPEPNSNFSLSVDFD